MAAPDVLAVLLKGAAAWNKWRRKPGAVLDLSKAKLIHARLRALDLSGADLKAAHLSFADLGRADLSLADLRGAELRYATLVGAQLSGAQLNGADLSRAQLSGANFSGSTFGSTILGGVDLSEAKGLDRVIHHAPSTIGIDTLYFSEGHIPEAFLRGAGVPDTLITFTKSLVANPIEFYSCFISYSTKDQEFAERLYADLQAKGVRCWFAPHDAKRGRKLHEQIDEAIRVHEKLLLILSPHSMNSNWVKTEIANARAREQQEGVQILFPVSIVPHSAILDWKCFDADSGSDSAREIRECLIADFHNWKNHDSYQKEFDLLLRDLQSKRKITGAS